MIHHTSDLFKNFPLPDKPSRKTERGELLKWIAEKVDRPIKQIAVLSTKLSLKDLYYIQSTMKDIERRNGKTSAQKWYWWSRKSGV